MVFWLQIPKRNALWVPYLIHAIRLEEMLVKMVGCVEPLRSEAWAVSRKGWTQDNISLQSLCWHKDATTSLENPSPLSL